MYTLPKSQCLRPLGLCIRQYSCPVMSMSRADHMVLGHALRYRDADAGRWQGLEHRERGKASEQGSPACAGNAHSVGSTSNMSASLSRLPGVVHWPSGTSPRGSRGKAGVINWRRGQVWDTGKQWRLGNGGFQPHLTLGRARGRQVGVTASAARLPIFQ